MIVHATIDEVRHGEIQIANCVYLVRDNTNKVLYVGRTVNLRSRFQNHLSHSHREKFSLVLKASLPNSLQWQLELWTDDEYHNDASALEALLIKTHQPICNMQSEAHALIRYSVDTVAPLQEEIAIEEVSPKRTMYDLVRLVTNATASPHTKRAYRRSLDDFLEWYQQSGWTKLNKAAVQEHIESLRSKGITASSINQRLTAIRKFAQEAADSELIDHATAQAIQRAEGTRVEGKRLGNWLTQNQAQEIINAPDITTPKGLRDRALLAVMLGCGLRRAEAASFCTDHIQQRESRWVIVDLVGKRNKTRSVPMPSWAKTAIDAWCNHAGITKGYIFLAIRRGGHIQQTAMTDQAIRNIVTEYAKQVNVDVAPHDLRRTFAKLAHKGGAPVDQIQLSLGHASMQTTERYLGVEQNLSSAPCDQLGLTL